MTRANDQSEYVGGYTPRRGPVALDAVPPPTPGPAPGARRTTVLLRPDDIANLKALSSALATTDTDCIRRALRLLRFAVESDGRLVLERGDSRSEVIVL